MTRSGQSLLEQCLEYSEDGYIRLTFLRLCQLPFPKRVTIRDDDLRNELLAQGVPAFSAGFCDWLDESTPVQVSVGWAWFVPACDARLFLAPGGMSSNVMITSPDGRDLGPARTDDLLKAWLSARKWQADVQFGQFGPVGSGNLSVH